MDSEKIKKIIREWIEAILFAVIVVFGVIRPFIVEAYKIPSASMVPTLEVRDRIFVNKFIYRFKSPERGDIVVFRYTENPKKYFVKRLVAKGGEVVEIRNGNIIIDGKLITEPEVFQKNYYYNMGKYGASGMEIEVPEGNFYFLGDNSASSKDSRYWGFVPRKYIVGKAFLRFWPLRRVGLIR